MQRLALAVAMVVITGALVSCQRQAANPDDPTAAFEAFNKAMEQRNYAAAAAVIDFDSIAAEANPDWNTFPTGQRTQITNKMREDTVSGLQGMGYPADGMESAEPQVTGDQATVTAQGGGKSLTLRLKKGTDGWRIVGGVPGMTTESGMGGG